MRSEAVEAARHFANEYVIPFGIRLVVAVLVFWVGRGIARALGRGFDRLMERSSVDVSLRKFLRDVVYAVLLVAVILVALDMLGVKTTAVIAVLGAASLAIGLALQGALSNFAAGVLLIVLRPYRVGDLVTLGKYLGRVDAIRVFSTTVVTADNREVIIPNAQIIGQPIENLTVLGRRRVDLLVTINPTPAAAGAPPHPSPDLVAIRTLLVGAVGTDERVFKSPEPAIELAEVGDTTVKLYVRPWTTSDAHGDVAAATMQHLREVLANAGLKFTIVLQ